MRELSELELEMVDGGFSITEIMVGGGILAGVALATAQMFKDQKSG